MRERSTPLANSKLRGIGVLPPAMVVDFVALVQEVQGLSDEVLVVGDVFLLGLTPEETFATLRIAVVLVEMILQGEQVVFDKHERDAVEDIQTTLALIEVGHPLVEVGVFTPVLNVDTTVLQLSEFLIGQFSLRDV